MANYYIDPAIKDTGNFYTDWINDRVAESTYIDPNTGEAKAGFWTGFGAEVFTLGGADPNAVAEGQRRTQQDREAREAVAESGVPMQYLYPDGMPDASTPLTPQGTQNAITAGRERQKQAEESRVGDQRIEEIDAQGKPTVDVANIDAGSRERVAAGQNATTVATTNATLADNAKGRDLQWKGKLLETDVSMAQIRSNSDLGRLQLQLSQDELRDRREDRREDRRRDMIAMMMKGLTNMGAAFAL